MRNLLALGAAAVIAFVVLGWFLDWYHISSKPTATGREYEVDVNSPKITEDINKGKEKFREMLNKDKGPVHQEVAPTPQTPPNGVPASFKTTNDGSFVYPGTGGNTPTPPAVPAPSSGPNLQFPGRQ